MVNFKGGGHQGEHKRALAAQGGEGGERAAVSKLEKLALRKEDAHGPGCARSVVNEGGLALLVVAREKRLEETNALLKAALVDAAALAHFQGRCDAHGTNAMGAPLVCRPGGDFVLAARAHPAAGPGEILLSEAQRMSLLVCEDDWYEWVRVRVRVRVNPHPHPSPNPNPRPNPNQVRVGAVCAGLRATGRARARGAAPG
jgi:hypothetical protein